MRLIGMLDSPYVRRVAISLKMMGLPFEHEPVSVFRHYEQFAAINPVVKAPTFVTDEGIVLMESSLILDHLERLAAPERVLTPRDIAAMRSAIGSSVLRWPHARRPCRSSTSANCGRSKNSISLGSTGSAASFMRPARVSMRPSTRRRRGFAGLDRCNPIFPRRSPGASYARWCPTWSKPSAMRASRRFRNARSGCLSFYRRRRNKRSVGRVFVDTGLDRTIRPAGDL